MAQELRNDGLGNHDQQMQEVIQREGSILQVTMKNFITYDSVAFSPGKSLNVVIGPNGTGKSTILMAIVLGLGGKPSHLGKQNTSIQDFIKSQCQEAQIEIELYRHRRNTIIKRTISKDGKSIWHLNGRQVPMKDIEAETRALNIQVDNLCQVLAQDRVQDFAKLDRRELLEATQKAVGKEGMSGIHSQLKELQHRQKQLEAQLAVDKKKREIEQGNVDRLKGAVEKMERRRGIEEEAEASKLKLSILMYKNKLNEVNTQKEKKKEAETEVRRISNLIEPYRQQITNSQQEYNATKNKQSGMEKKIRNQLEKVKLSRDKLENLRHEILDLEVAKEKRLKSVEKQKSKEDKVRQAISKIKNDIAGIQSIPAKELDAQLQTLKREIENLAKQNMITSKKRLEIDDEIRDLINKLNSNNREIMKLKNFKELRLRQLQEASPDAFRAAQWIEEHRNMFEKPVYLPMIVELDVVPEYARYVENAIGYNDMIAIVCESKEDMKLIIDNCRKSMKLRLNVLHADPGCPPMPTKNFENVKAKFPAFEQYLINVVKGPNTLINFLCRSKQFHNIPVAFSNVEASDDFSVYFAGDYRKGHRRSSYRTDLLYSSEPIGQARYFKQVSSQVDEDKILRNSTEIKKHIEEKRMEQESAQKRLNDIENKRNQLRDEMNKKSQSQVTVQNMRFQLGQKEKDLRDLEMARADPQSIETEFSNKLKTATLNLVNEQEPFYKTLKDFDNYLVSNELLGFEVNSARSLLESAKRFCKAEQEAWENAKLSLERISNSLSEVKTEAKSQLNAIRAKSSNKEPAQIWSEFEGIFSALPNTIEELETHIEDKMAFARMLGGGSDADVRKFQEHARQLESLTASIADREARTSKLVEEMEKREAQWKTELLELVDAISSNFSRCFSEMKCAGQVDLYTGNNEHDYDNYGLRVRVRFREDEELQDLNAHTQSGGERAVSTAIYMLALQELTPAPFRLVDEINQGMDSKNERKVYELLLQSTSRRGTPQYFLLTPKLLKDMNYNPGTTVLCVMNSACAPSHKSWDLDKFIAVQKRLGSSNNYDSNGNAMEDDD